MSHPARPLPTALPTPESAAPAPHPTLVPTAADATSWPWYRSEPWLAVELSAFVPLLVVIAFPGRFQIALLALAGLLVVLGLVMLVRQGPFAPRRPSDHR
ncbi:hypothetical protein [Roseisolibacter agri]|nr:hypothetical protein [Roseisolibacter agri]